ncbi:MAG: hypothetical protein NC033_04320 [Clostridiales bacterium]|nr:hypothetical protein [Clostridiales bacterium]
MSKLTDKQRKQIITEYVAGDGKDRFIGRLNIGIREDGKSTLYDLNPFDKQ